MYDSRANLPPGVTTSRMIAYVQGGLGVLQGLILVFGNQAIANAYGLSGHVAGVVVAVIGVVILAISALLIWGGVQLGRLSPGARIGVLIYEWLAVIIGLVGLLNPGLGLVSLALAGVAVYYLQFDRRTREAFAAADGTGRAGRGLVSRPTYAGPPPRGQGVHPAPGTPPPPPPADPSS